MNKELIEERLHYLVENFELIQQLVEREKARPKAVFGWRAGGVFNNTDEDILWGSDFVKEQPTEDKSTHTSKGADLDSPSTITKDEVVKEVTKAESKIHHKSEGATLTTKTNNPWHKPLKKQHTTRTESKKDNTDARTNANTINSATPDISIRESRGGIEEGDSKPIGEDRRTTTNNTKTEEPVEQEPGGAEQVNKPTTKIKAPKKIEQPFNSYTSNDTIKNKPSTIDHKAIAEAEYEAACNKKGIDYVDSEERHRRAKEGANKIRNNRQRPFDDFRKLW